MENTITFNNCFNAHISKFTIVVLDKEHEGKLVKAIGGLITKRKQLKKLPLSDLEIKDYKKLFMQLAGDVVMEQYLDLDFVDYDNITSRINEPYINKILPGKKIDIATFAYGNFPLVYDKTYKKTIFICMSENKKEYYICGMGDPKMIDGFSKKDLVMSDYLRNKGKSAFYAFYNLKPVPNFMYDFHELIR